MGLMDMLPFGARSRLDPARTREARAAFDDAGRYDAWAAFCRSRAPQPPRGRRRV